MMQGSLIEYFEFQQGIVEAGLVVGQNLHDARFNTVFAWLTMQVGHDTAGTVARAARGSISGSSTSDGGDSSTSRTTQSVP
jgi:hypothetical protein